MRSLLSLLVCSLSVSAAAQTALPLNASLPADKGRGEAKTELRLRFKEPLKISKSDDESGLIYLIGGQPVSEERKDALLNRVTTTACTLVTTPKLSLVGDSLVMSYNDLTLSGDQPIDDIYYQSSLSLPWDGAENVKISGQVDARISLNQGPSDPDANRLVAIVVSRSYFGPRDTQTIEKALTVSPASLRDCLGVSVDVIEVEATQK